MNWENEIQISWFIEFCLKYSQLGELQNSNKMHHNYSPKKTK